MLVAGAAALLVALGDVVVRRFEVYLGSELVRSDPVRIVEAVITGVSFLGAGTIIRHRGSRRIEGLTTAAAALFTAGVGVCALVTGGSGAGWNIAGARYAARRGPVAASSGAAAGPY